MMQPASSAQTRAPVLLPGWVLAAAAVAVTLQCAAFYGVRKDDAFITYRYAQNLVSGHGLVFNPGERVMGSTSPGHVFLSALMYSLVGKGLLPSAMACLGCLGWTAQALAAFCLVRRVLPLAAACIVSLAIAVGASNAPLFVSLETHIVAALLCWGLVCAVERRWMAAAVLVALAGLFRPDMYLAALMLGVVCLWELRARAAKVALIFTAITAPWHLFALDYFGTVLPQSAAAKYHRTYWLEYAVFAFRVPSENLWPFPPSVLPALLCWVLAAAGAVFLVRRDPRLWPLPAYLVLHYGAYLYLRPYKHQWHLYPTSLLFAVLALSAIASLSVATRPATVRGFALVCTALLALAYGHRSLQFAQSHGQDYWFGARDTAYREIARYLNKHARRSDVIASVEVGTIAYYSNMTMYDWGGLITAHPLQRPLRPRLSWTVVDKLFIDRFAVGMTPIKQFRTGDFFANVYSFDLMAAAAQRVLDKHRDVGLTHATSQLQQPWVQEMAALAHAMEQSGQRVDVFLRERARMP